MSLINEALKKAQKERTGETPSLSAAPTIGGERPDQISRRGKSSGMGELLLPLGLGAAVVAMLAVGAVFFFTRKSETPAPASPPSVASTTPVASQPVSPPVQSAPPVPVVPPPVVTAPPPQAVAVTTPPPEPTTVSSFTVPNVTAPATVPVQPEPVRPAAPVVTTPAPVPVVATVTPPSTPAPQPVQPVVPAAPPKFEPRAINYIEALRVTGIRVSSEPRESKVLMNDRVYRLGSLVEAEMGLRLVGITAASLTFEDDRGARYTRLFN